MSRELIVILDDIRSHHNVGSVFRSSDAFGVKMVILGGITPAPPHRDIQKTALGSTESVPWEKIGNLAEELGSYKAEGFKIMAIEQHQRSIPMPEKSTIEAEKIAIILGNEVSGVKEELIQIADEVWEIPQFGVKKSLNVSVCAGICIHHIIGP